MPMLQLEKYFYPNISIKANPDFKPEKKELSGRLKVESKVNLLSKEDRRWEISLSIKTVPETLPMPYQFELETVGIFVVSPNFPEEKMEEMVRIAASSILYSASREFLLIVTSRAPFGSINLPTITFQKKLTKVKENKTPADNG